MNSVSFNVVGEFGGGGQRKENWSSLLELTTYAVGNKRIKKPAYGMKIKLVQ